MSRVLITGFITIDFIAHVNGFPQLSVTENATGFDVACGGRAANQAMALTAIESNAALLARVGSDEHASLLTEELVEIGVDTEFLQHAPSMTGIRLICERENGERQVVIHRGANDYLSVDDLNRRAAAIRNASAFGVTTEPAGAVTLRALEIATSAKVPTVLTHSASARPVSDRLLGAADVLVTSTSTCSGLLDPSVALEHPEAALRALVQRGASAVILLTPDRALLTTAKETREAKSLGRLDTEDAVDAFVAGLLQGFSEKEALDNAVLRGVRTAVLLVDE